MNPLQQDFEALMREVNDFHFYYQTFRRLYLDNTDNEVEQFHRISPYFFMFHHKLMLERLYLGLRRLTDPPSTRMRGETRFNLSFRYFVENLAESDDRADLCRQVSSFEDVVQPLKTTMHRRLGHLDRGMWRGDDDEQWLNIDEFSECCEMVFTITNRIAVIGFNYSTGFFDPQQGRDLDRFIEQMCIPEK